MTERIKINFPKRDAWRNKKSGDFTMDDREMCSFTATIKKKKRGEWTVKYPQCFTCKKNDRKHIAKGFCEYCYYSDLRKKIKKERAVKIYVN